MNPTSSATAAAASTGVTGAPFDLDDTRAYGAWRARKLADAPSCAADLTVPVAAPETPTAEEIAALRAQCGRANMALYRTSAVLTKEQVLALSAAVGLTHLERPLLTGEDGITELSVAGMANDGIGGDKRRGIYIPYSNKPLSWHTDGYYNPTGQWVLGMVLHCVRPAASGGASQFLDPDIAYIRLRDENPAWVAALMHPETLTIPANDVETDRPRGAETGPAFAVIGGRLAMRYTHRLRSAVWRDDADTQAARGFLRALLEDGDPMVLDCRLAAGEGIISNNVLHRRTGFENPSQSGAGRLLYRARFRDRIDA